MFFLPTLNIKVDHLNNFLNNTLISLSSLPSTYLAIEKNKNQLQVRERVRILELDLSQLDHLLTVGLRNLASLSLVCGVCVCMHTCMQNRNVYCINHIQLRI